jgi:hypothetical protein
VKVRNDSGKNLSFTVMGESITCKDGEVFEISDAGWNLIMGSDDNLREYAKQYWRGLFPNELPRLTPLPGRGGLKDKGEENG